MDLYSNIKTFTCTPNGVFELHCNLPGGLVWFSVGPQWKKAHSVLGESF